MRLGNIYCAFKAKSPYTASPSHDVENFALLQSFASCKIDACVGVPAPSSTSLHSGLRQSKLKTIWSKQKSSTAKIALLAAF